MKLKIPHLSVVVLVGPSGAGKSTFAQKHFLPSEVLSSDHFRGLVSDDTNNQAATNDAFEVLHYVAAKRLARGNLTVIDATNVQKEARLPLVSLARKYHCLPVAIVLNAPEKICEERNRVRQDRNFSSHVVKRQRSQLRGSLKSLKREGFRHVFVLDTVEEINDATVERVPLWNDKRSMHGPFDVIGDVHGCCDELQQLLERLDYRLVRAAKPEPGWNEFVYEHPEGRKAVFVGDLVDRGPRVLDTVRLVRGMIDRGSALCVPGNHEARLLRKLRGRNVQMTHGLDESWNEIKSLPVQIRDTFSKQMAEFFDGLISHYVLDDGKLVVAHAGLKEEMQGRGSGKVRAFCLYGDTTGETDERGLPIRLNWAADYRGSATVVYGHTPVLHSEWLNNTVCIDTGCVFGGKLTAMRYPEREFVSIPAERTYCDPPHPFLSEETESRFSAQQLHDDMLDAADVTGKRIVSTRLHRNVTIREENSTAALEVMSRFAVNPKWLVYLPPTMSPCETSNEQGLLEHPTEVFSYFRSQGVPQVVCQEKHMGSRAVVVICRNEEAAVRRFGVSGGETGIVYTRTGRRFFPDVSLEQEFLKRIRTAMTEVGFWEEFDTTWACLDCELLPWSAKAQELLRSQYAAVGAAGRSALASVESRLSATASRLSDGEATKLAGVSEHMSARRTSVERFTAAYRQYCWPVESVSDLKLAPFHLLATERRVHNDKSHVWHMKTLARLCAAAPDVMRATQHRSINVTDQNDVSTGIDWWLQLTANGGEGMVVKPSEWIVRGKKGLVQPAMKCRGREYLRIIYSPDYDSDQNLPRLRSRRLGRKRSLALREFALGMESLERFIRNEPLRQVHECVFGVLALESEPVDPRL